MERQRETTCVAVAVHNAVRGKLYVIVSHYLNHVSSKSSFPLSLLLVFQTLDDLHHPEPGHHLLGLPLHPLRALLEGRQDARRVGTLRLWR